MAKEYVIQQNLNLVEIKWNGGGRLPDALKGLFTSRKEAQLAVDNYENSEVARRKTKRKMKDAETEG